LDEEKIKQIFANYRSEDSPMSLPEHLSSLDRQDLIRLTFYGNDIISHCTAQRSSGMNGPFLPLLR